MAAAAGEADAVVASYPVYLHREGATDPGGSLFLLQSPLRPLDRPYELHSCGEIRPKQGRVELDLPLDTQSATYDCQAPTQLRIKSLSVQGKPVTLKAAEHGSLAVATFACGALHLAPLSAVVQLRPSLAHLDAADEAKREAERASAGGKKGAEEEEGEEEGADQLTPLQVQVRRRETERQAEQRLASHAYLRAQQEEEPWAKLQPHGPDSPASQAALSRLRATPSGRAGEPVAPASFLDALLPPRTRASPPSDAMEVKRS